MLRCYRTKIILCSPGASNSSTWDAKQSQGHLLKVMKNQRNTKCTKQCIGSKKATQNILPDIAGQSLAKSIHFRLHLVGISWAVLQPEAVSPLLIKRSLFTIYFLDGSDRVLCCQRLDTPQVILCWRCLFATFALSSQRQQSWCSLKSLPSVLRQPACSTKLKGPESYDIVWMSKNWRQVIHYPTAHNRFLQFPFPPPRVSPLLRHAQTFLDLYVFLISVSHEFIEDILVSPASQSQCPWVQAPGCWSLHLKSLILLT